MLQIPSIALTLAAASFAVAAPDLAAPAPAALEKAARSGDEQALKQIVEFYINKGDEKNALLWLDKAVEHDLPDALLLRSMILKESCNDAEQALVYGRRAVQAAKTRAEQGDPYYQLMLGCLYQSGANGACPVDEKEALRWIRKAAAQNFPAARVALIQWAPPQYSQEQEAAFLKEDTERARQFVADHPDITGGDGRSEKTAYAIRLRWPDSNPLIEQFLDYVYPDAYETGNCHSRGQGDQAIRQVSLVDRNCRRVSVYFTYPDRPNPYDKK